MDDAIGTWQAMTEADERSPVFSDTATVLGSLTAIEERTRELRTR